MKTMNEIIRSYHEIYNTDYDCELNRVIIKEHTENGGDELIETLNEQEAAVLWGDDSFSHYEFIGAGRIVVWLD